MPERQEHHISQEDVLRSSSSFFSPPPGATSIASSLDELAKGLATGTLSRGKAISWMGGALLGTALASVPEVAWADDDCRRLGRECRRDSQCCSKNCIRRGDDKVCGCPEGQTRCNDRCVNLERNERHCGRCFNRCDEGEECVEDECRGTCPSGTTPCGTECCTRGQECVGGVCQCPSGTALCGGECVSTECPTGQTFDPSTCGCLPICPAQPCCCDCNYRDNTTGAQVNLCQSGVANDEQECNNYCRENTPEGTTFLALGFVCSSAPTEEAIVCSATRQCSELIQCTSPPA